MGDFRDLLVWQKAHLLALRAYELTSDFPASEHYALRDQIRRAGISIPANIAEGNGRQGNRAFAYFLDVALGSLCELQALMLLARDLTYVEADSTEDLLETCEELGKMISSLASRCRKK